MTRDITERREAEEQFRFQARLLDAVGQAIIATDPQGTIIYWNRAAQELYGWSKEEVMGRPIVEVTPSQEMLERAKEIMSELRAGMSWSGEFVVQRKDGSTFPAMVTDTPVHDEQGNLAGIVGVSTDIAEIMKMKELRRSEQRFRLLAENAQDLIYRYRLKPTPSFEYVSPSATAIIGYTPEEHYADPELRFKLVHPDDRHLIEEALRSPESLITIRWLRKDGGVIWIEQRTKAIYDGAGELVAIEGIARDVTERRRAENNLRQNLSATLALREADQVLSSTLESEEVVTRLLKIMQNVSDLTAAVINVHDEAGRLHIWRSVGLERLWQRARFVQEAEIARLAAMESEERRLFRLRHPHFGRESLVGLCLPLKVKDRVIGVLEAYGLEMLAQNDTVEILDSLASQAASALENARLYEQLEERERKLHDLVEKLLRAQEEERRHVAYEVHDGLAQVAVASHQHLQAFASRYTPSEERGQRDLERILKLVRGTVSDARQIIASLRPTTLDDLGLAATISLEVERLREEGYQVHYEEELGNDRLPNVVEITIFRVIQESLTNMRKYAQTQQVHIKLERRKDHAYLKVQDFGRGFDPTAVSAGSGPAQKVGLAGMRERLTIVNGKLEIYSPPGVGTSVVATIPLMEAP